MINLTLIPHSNTFVERIFSHFNATKDETRNLLDVATASSLMKVKSYHLNDKQLFEPTEEHNLKNILGLNFIVNSTLSIYFIR